MAGRYAERSKSRCNSVSPIPKGKIARQIYLRARYFASGISRQGFVKRGNKGAALKSSQAIANWRHLSGLPSPEAPWRDCRATSALGHERTFRSAIAMSAGPVPVVPNGPVRDVPSDLQYVQNSQAMNGRSDPPLVRKHAHSDAHVRNSMLGRGQTLNRHAVAVRINGLARTQ